MFYDTMGCDVIKFNNRSNLAESLADTTSPSTVPALRLKMALPDAQVTQGHFFLKVAWIHRLPQNQKRKLASITYLVILGRLRGGGEDERDILNLFGHMISQLPPPPPLHILPPPTLTLFQLQ